MDAKIKKNHGIFSIYFPDVEILSVLNGVDLVDKRAMLWKQNAKIKHVFNDDDKKSTPSSRSRNNYSTLNIEMLLDSTSKCLGGLKHRQSNYW